MTTAFPARAGRRPRLSRRALLGAAAASLVAWGPGAAQPVDARADGAALFRAAVTRRLDIPPSEIWRYGELAQAALDRNGVALSQPQYLAVVDRHPFVQAVIVMWRSAQGEWSSVGAAPVSTGMPGSFDHFETPLGVFAHTPMNPDFRAEGTVNDNGIRGYGVKGMRVYDFGWQRVPKGWGDGKVIEMRLQMHATDPGALETRLGSAQSKGCIRIPAELNRWLDHYGVLDAEYELAARESGKLWVLSPDREPLADAGRYLVVVESVRSDRPDWSPPPFLPHRRPATPSRQ